MPRIPAWAANLRHNQRARDAAFCVGWAVLFGASTAVALWMYGRQQHALSMGGVIGIATFVGLFAYPNLPTRWSRRLGRVITVDIALLAVLVALITAVPREGETSVFATSPSEPVDSVFRITSSFGGGKSSRVQTDTAELVSPRSEAQISRPRTERPRPGSVRVSGRPGAQHRGTDIVRLGEQARSAMDSAEALGRAREYVQAFRALDNATVALMPHSENASIADSLSRLASRRDLLYDACIEDPFYTGECDG